MYSTLKALVLPPANLLFLLVIALIALHRQKRQLASGLLGVAIVVFYFLSASFFSSFLARAVQTVPIVAASQLQEFQAQAMVVLAAGYARSGREYESRTIDGVTLQRLRYAVHINRSLQLPILVSGGQTRSARPALADLMRKALEQDFATPVRWVENRSFDTAQNGAFSAKLLKADGIARIILVTDASHMPRARAMFERQGLIVLCAGTDYAADDPLEPQDLVPRMSSFEESYDALYELFAQIRDSLSAGTT
jgi:uncharacterized SAM-binding protein YcdF (DUF218 family)